MFNGLVAYTTHIIDHISFFILCKKNYQKNVLSTWKESLVPLSYLRAFLRLTFWKNVSIIGGMFP